MGPYNTVETVERPQNTETKFGELVYPVDLGRVFSSRGVQYRVVASSDMHQLEALALNGTEKDHVMRFAKTLDIEAVSPRVV